MYEKISKHSYAAGFIGFITAILMFILKQTICAVMIITQLYYCYNSLAQN